MTIQTGAAAAKNAARMVEAWDSIKDKVNWTRRSTWEGQMMDRPLLPSDFTGSKPLVADIGVHRFEFCRRWEQVNGEAAFVVAGRRAGSKDPWSPVE